MRNLKCQGEEAELNNLGKISQILNIWLKAWELEKVSDILYDAIDTNEINCMDLFADMQEEMMTNGFLAQMMESLERAQEQKKTPSKAKAKN